MTSDVVMQLVYSGIFLVVVYLLFHLLARSARKTQEKLGIRRSRYFSMRRLLFLAAILTSVGGLIFIWGLTLKNVWVAVSSVLAVVAIAFFAVWSLVGNILAGIILYFTSPFKIDDEIEVSPDPVRGQVMAINTFYTVLLDADKNHVNIPNSMFFQKYIRVKARSSKGWGDDSAVSENED